MKRLNTFLLCLGVVFLLWLVWKVEPGKLWRELSALGWGVVPLILSEGLANLLHTAGWRHCIGGGARGIPLLRLFRMAMAGFAINYLTPTASLGGEITKASLLASGRGGSQAISSVLMDKLCLAFAHLVLVVLGSFVLLGRVQLPGQLWAALVASGLLLTGGIVTFLLLQKYGRLGGLVRWLVARRVGGRFLQKASHQISQVDEVLKVFYRQRPVDLGLSVAWHLLGHSVAIFQAWLFLLLLNQSVSITTALVAAFLGLWFDLLTFAVPLNLGALEGGRILALKSVGFAAPLGMTFGVAIRLAQVFWAVFGLVNYGLLTTTRSRAKPSAVQPAKGGSRNEPAWP
jgi:hypothetical protein